MQQAITIFHFLFQGVLLFQVILFGYLYASSQKKEMVYFAIFLFLLLVNFLLNSTELYGITDHANFMYSKVYNFINTPIVIIANIFYIMFLKTFYTGFTKSKLFFQILNVLRITLICALIGFFILFFFDIISNLLFNILHLLGIIAGIWLAILIYKEKLPFGKFMVPGFVANLTGTLCTVILLLFQNIHTDHVLVRDYPYTFIQLGLLIEILFFNLAIVSKWTRLEREEAIFDLKSELAIAQLRSQLSKELHDDIGAELSGINLYSHMATTQSSAGKMEEATKSISVIRDSSTKVINRLKDIVWAINPVENELQNLMDKIEEFARYVVNAVGIQVELKIPENLPILNFSSQIKHHLFLISKEVINNAVKYSKATHVVIQAGHKNGIFSLMIKDNGIGFNVNNVPQGNGLSNIKRRAQEINAVLDIKSSPQAGTAVRVSCAMK